MTRMSPSSMPSSRIESPTTRPKNVLAGCLIAGDFTVKRVRIEPNAVWLIPANPKYSLIKITKENEFIVWGIVTYTIKKNRRKR